LDQIKFGPDLDLIQILNSLWAHGSASLLSLWCTLVVGLLSPPTHHLLLLQCPPPASGLARTKHSSVEPRPGRIAAVSTRHLPLCHRCHVHALKHLSEQREPPKMTPLLLPRLLELFLPPFMKTGAQSHGRHYCRRDLHFDQPLHRITHPADDQNGSGHTPPCSPSASPSLTPRARRFPTFPHFG
jgi:hypothetical protein